MEQSKTIIQKLSEPLKISDVDFRVQSINNGGFATILAYKDARVDMNRLDAVCGGLWQKEYHFIESKNMLFCKVGIKIDGEWIWKEDVGTESNTEAIKGQASDAFKRACFNWGIGRELYDYPLINVKLNTNEFTTGSNGKKKQTYNLKLKEWKWQVEWENGSVKTLTAIDEKGNKRYSYKKGQKTTVETPPTTNTAPANTTPEPTKWLNVTDKERNFTKEWLNVLEAINKREVNSVADVREHYKVSNAAAKKIEEALNFQAA